MAEVDFSNVVEARGSGQTWLFDATALNASLQIGDAVIAVLGSQVATTEQETSMTTVEPGFIRLGTNSVSNARILGIYGYPVTDQAALDAIEDQIAFTQTAGSGRYAGHLFRVSGLDLENFSNWVAGVWEDTDGGGIPDFTFEPLTGGAVPSLVLGAISYSVGGGQGTLEVVDSGGYSHFTTSEPEDASGVSTTQVSTFYQNSDTSSASLSVTYNGDLAGVTGGYLVALPALSEPAEAFLWDGGALTPGRWYTTLDGGSVAPAAQVRAMPRGHASVADMLADPPFYGAHRGGSTIYPEMSLHGYTQSVWRGFDFLEISVARSKDGVWFGLHDPDLARITGLDRLASEMLWTDLRTIEVPAPDGSDESPQPLARLDEILAAYYGSHVLFIDIKAAASYRDEMFGLLNSLPGDAKQSVVAKYHEADSPWIRDAVAEGYPTWGYYYHYNAGDESSWQNANAADLTMVGLNHTAAQSAWDDIALLGKPIIGHVCATQSAVNEALSKGAAGAMVSGVNVVDPN